MKLSDRNFACVSLALVALHLVFFFRQDLLVSRFAEAEAFVGVISFVVLDALLAAILLLSCFRPRCVAKRNQEKQHAISAIHQLSRC